MMELVDNTAAGQTVYTIIATDAVGVTGYTLGGTHGNILSVNNSTGVVILPDVPDYFARPSYSFTVTASDAAGNTSSPVTVTFSIIPNTAPSITLTGDDLNIDIGSTYVDPGYSASDPSDGDITSNVIITGTVDTSIPATYTLSYDVSDDQGLAADTVYRIVVVDRFNNTSLHP